MYSCRDAYGFFRALLGIILAFQQGFSHYSLFSNIILDEKIVENNFFSVYIQKFQTTIGLNTHKKDNSWLFPTFF